MKIIVTWKDQKQPEGLNDPVYTSAPGRVVERLLDLQMDIVEASNFAEANAVVRHYMADSRVEHAEIEQKYQTLTQGL